MKVLVNAYACSPNMGSEPGMAWNWCVNLANYCELFIITEGEFRDNIESVLPNLPQGANMHFYYNPVSDRIRQMCWNQGDWRFYYYYRQWQKKTLIIAQDICQHNHIDIIHQLNMIGFREPGLLWKIEGPKFVFGPIGGLMNIPVLYLLKNSKKETLKVILKKAISSFQIRFSTNVRSAINKADILLGATKEEVETIEKVYGKKILLMPETGTSSELVAKGNIDVFQNSFNILWVGRFIPTKQLGLALEVMNRLRNYKNVRLHIVGDGSDADYYKKKASSLGISGNCVWHGYKDNATVQFMMQNADLFLFTSIAEASSTVVLESISNNLPVVCFDACGMSSIVTEDIGFKIPITHYKKSVVDFANIIEYILLHREELANKSSNCISRAEQLSWKNKAELLFNLYQQLF